MVLTIFFLIQWAYLEIEYYNREYSQYSSG